MSEAAGWRLFVSTVVGSNIEDARPICPVVSGGSTAGAVGAVGGVPSGVGIGRLGLVVGADAPGGAAAVGASVDSGWG